MATCMNLYAPCVPQARKMLNNLGRWLDLAVEYAKEKDFDPNVLLSYRLSPDQFALLRQIQTTCDTAKLTAARLTGKAAPSYPDDEQTVEQLKERIQKTIAYLDTLTTADFEGAETKLVELRFAPGQGARGEEYYLSFAQPNFYFHLTHCYALLRHAGVPIGKRTFIGSMETEAMPS